MFIFIGTAAVLTCGLGARSIGFKARTLVVYAVAVSFAAASFQRNLALLGAKTLGKTVASFLANTVQTLKICGFLIKEEMKAD
jgi:hypothetical protein